MATAMWREATDDPLPKMPPGRAGRSDRGTSSFSWSRCCSPRRRPRPRRKVADLTWDLVHDRDDGDPVKRRVVAGPRGAGQARGRGRHRGRVVVSPLFSRRWAARSLGFLFISGSAVGVVTLLLPHDPMVKEGPIYGLAALATTIGLVTLARADSMSELALHATLATGTCIVGAANYFVGTGSLYPIMYCWTALYAFTFFPFRAAVGTHGADRRVVRGRARGPGGVEPGRAVGAHAGDPARGRSADRAAARSHGRAARAGARGERDAHPGDRGGRARRLRHDRVRRQRRVVEPPGRASVRDPLGPGARHATSPS